jgi:indolepyruvate ferredoxin oxidoreductase beta subunit
MVLLGAASVIIRIEHTLLQDAIAKVFGRKGEDIVEKNLTAFRAGRIFAEEQLKL